MVIMVIQLCTLGAQVFVSIKNANIKCSKCFEATVTNKEIAPLNGTV